MAEMQFIADVDKRVEVNGIVRKISFPNIPDGVELFYNGIPITSGQVIPIESDVEITTIKNNDSANVTINYENVAIATVNGESVPNGYNKELSGDVLINFVGALDIPDISLNGDGINSLTINGNVYQGGELPVTFQPIANKTNDVFMNGSAGEAHRLTISGTNLDTLKVNDVQQEIPYVTTVTEDLIVVAVGEEHVINFETKGAKISVDGTVLTDGNEYTQIMYDVTESVVMEIDGTHELTIDGEYVKSVTVNGVTQEVDELPITVYNAKMSAHVDVDGYTPSTIAIVGNYMEDVTLDGAPQELNEDGSYTYNLSTFNENHNLTMNGTQPREFYVTVVDNNATTVKVNGKVVENNQTIKTFSDVLIEATPEPIPLTFETGDTVKVDVNGRHFEENSFTISVDGATEIDVYTQTCTVNVSFANGSFTMILPQSIVTISAPQRDGWIFDTWTSTDVGITSPRNVLTTLDLRGKASVNLIANYQQWCAVNSPSVWS